MGINKIRALCCTDSTDVLVVLSADSFVVGSNTLFQSYCWSLIFAIPGWLSTVAGGRNC